MWALFGMDRLAANALSAIRHVVTLVLLLAPVSAVAPAPALGQFRLGVQDLALQGAAHDAASAGAAYRSVDTGKFSIVRINVSWKSIAPPGNTPPVGFNQSNPGAHGYNWTEVDAAVRDAVSHHKVALLTMFYAPDWAEGPRRPSNSNIYPGAWDPSAGAFARFARAAAVRYSGSFKDSSHRKLPRVRYWQVWNEENLPYYLAAPNLVAEYRALLNAGYGSIKSVHRDNVVLTGGLASVSFLAPLSMSPLTFAADLFCLQQVGREFTRAASCSQQAQFDAFGMHPYTLAATPTKHAYNYNDVLVGDMGKVKGVVNTADRLHTVAGARHHQIWVSEWGWLTNPPNRQVGEKPATAARYVAYAMYEMWHNSVDVVIWQTIFDHPGLDTNGRGLFNAGHHAKPTFRAFTFPVIASVRHGHGYVWGREPGRAHARVLIERRQGHSWTGLGSVRAGSDGVFQMRFHAHGNGDYRAHVLGGSTSLAYDSRPIPGKRTRDFNSG